MARLEVRQPALAPRSVLAALPLRSPSTGNTRKGAEGVPLA